jgi:hypothetical protein
MKRVRPKLRMDSISIASAALFLAVPAHAFDEGEGGFFYNGNKLQELCKVGAAINYVVGAYDAAQYMSVFNGELAGLVPRFCSPKGSITTQYSDIVCQYVDQHPEKRTESAFSLISSALSEAWPCP